MTEKNFIVDEVRRVVTLLGRDDITRDEFLQNAPLISRRDLETVFGGWSAAFEAAGYKSLKHKFISNEVLFQEYARLLKLLGHYPLGVEGQKEISANSKYSAGVFKKRFQGGLKAFAVEYVKQSKENNKQQVFSERVATITGKSKIIVPFLREVIKVSGSRFYNGKAAEYLTIAELLFRGYNAQGLPVDEGLDIFAVKDKVLYLIQVKHSDYRKPSESGLIQLTVSSLEKNKGVNVFYILVLSRKEPTQRDFLIMPYSKIDELIKIGVLKQEDEAKHISFKVLHKNPDDAFIGEYREMCNVSRYLNAWDVLL